MRQYQLYIRPLGVGPWRYVDTFTDASLAWQGMMLARAKGCTARMIMATSGQIAPAAESLSHG